MIAQVKLATSVPAWHAKFLNMLPTIRRHARIAFRELDAEAKEDAIHEVVANCLVAFIRLYQQGKTDLAYPTVLAGYGVRQVREGRRVCTKQNCRDIMSAHCQRKNCSVVERLDRFDREEQGWQEIVVEDRRSTPAEIAATRIDFRSWLGRLTRRDRNVAELLATGESTKEAARMLGLTAGRISQLRRELKDSWEEFQGVLALA